MQAMRTPTAAGVALIAALAPPSAAWGVPSFARQTGLECVACHVSWPELTSVGRQFKLGAYTLTQPAKGEDRPLVSFAKDTPPPRVPLAAFLQASISRTARTNTAGTDAGSFP